MLKLLVYRNEGLLDVVVKIVKLILGIGIGITRLTILIFCIFTIMNMKVSFYSVILLLFYFLFEINIFLLSELKRRSLNTYKNNIILTLGVIILIFLNFQKSEIVIFNLKNILVPYSSIDSEVLYKNTLKILSIFLIILSFLNKIKKEKKYINKNNLLSFRKDELKKVKMCLDDDDIQTILLDGKIGNGKTEIIENLIKDFDENKFETIYLKLPLVESVEELKITIILELKIIFNKYGINSNYLNDFLRNVSVLKTNFFEFNFSQGKNNNWNNIQILKKDLERLLKNKKRRLLIILDDIEREEDLEKIKKSIYFLGELSEYFRGTKATIIFLAEYKKILEQLENKLNSEGKKSFNKILLEKYFGVIIKIREIDLQEFTESDIRILVGNKIFNEDISDEYIKIITKLLNQFSKICKESNTDYNESIRAIKVFLKQMKWMALRKEYDTTSWLIINILSLVNIFLGNGSCSKNIENLIKEKLFNKMMIFFEKKITYKSVIKEIDKIEIELKKGKEISEDFQVDIETGIKVIKEDLVLDQEIELGYLGRKIIFDYIGNDKTKMETFLKNKFIVSKTSVIEKIIEMKLSNLDFLSELSKIKLKTILLERELSYLEHEDLAREAQEEAHLEYIQEEIEKNRSIPEKLDNLKEITIKKNKEILRLINNDKFFIKDYNEIKNILEKDLAEDIYSTKYLLENQLNTY